MFDSLSFLSHAACSGLMRPRAQSAWALITSSQSVPLQLWSRCCSRNLVIAIRRRLLGNRGQPGSDFSATLPLNQGRQVRVLVQRERSVSPSMKDSASGTRGHATGSTSASAVVEITGSSSARPPSSRALELVGKLSVSASYHQRLTM